MPPPHLCQRVYRLLDSLSMVLLYSISAMIPGRASGLEGAESGRSRLVAHRPSLLSHIGVYLGGQKQAPSRAYAGVYVP